LDAQADMTRAESRDLVSERWSASAGIVAYELDLFGRIRSLSKQALETYFATEEGRRSAQIALVAEVATRYFGLRQAEEQLILARETLAAVEQLYALNKATFDVGATNELNLRTSEGQVQSVRISVITYEREVAQARNAIVFLLGAELPDSLPLPRAFLDGGLLAKIPAGLPSDLVQRRPDILQSEHELYAANANVGAARAAFFPQVRLTGSLGSESDELANLFGNGTGVWSFSPRLTLPIFTAGRNKSNLEAAKIEVQIKVAAYEKTVQRAFREVSDALVATKTYAEQTAVQEAAIGVQRRVIGRERTPI
jgi:multidrug efflux system outer membrane protein